MGGKYTLDYIKHNNLILLEVISGSVAYGTNVPTSDLDIRGVFICEYDDILSNNYPQQINDATNDITFYELGRFLQLVKTNNPNILELLNTPEDCIKYKNPLFDLILEKKDEFITKQCRNSFGAYAISQIKKATGLDKKQNWEKERVTRKDLLDFCYVIEGNKSIPFRKWNETQTLFEYGVDQKFCGVVNIPNAKDVYALYFDVFAYERFSELVPQKIREGNLFKATKGSGSMGLGYKGLQKVGGDQNAGISNQLRLSSVPKDETPLCTIVYNKDGYGQHCKDFKEYQEWLEKRNTARYVETQKHGQQIDGKNMMHCVRLLRTAMEIGSGKGIQVRRNDAAELLKIRRGELSLESILDWAELAIVEMDSIFDHSDLPNSVDPELINEILITVRRKFYSKEGVTSIN